ncbi:hypothetical protein HKX48_008685 [Thoreauomyces humboldtii]|nr:hypothetical protein HKX48_008685 [Thoreauomyces humboldtii]
MAGEDDKNQSSNVTGTESEDEGARGILPSLILPTSILPRSSPETPVAPTDQPTVPAPSTTSTLNPFSLTQEQRDAIRQQLVARQRAARAEKPSGTSVGSKPFPVTTSSRSAAAPVALGPASDTSPSPTRGALVASAVSFLQSPAAQQAAWDRKRQFLLGKGLSEEEILQAARTAGVSTSVAEGYPSQQSPPGYGPPRIAATVAATDRWKSVILALVLASGGAVGLAALVKRSLLPARQRYQEESKAYANNLTTLLRPFLSKTVELSTLHSRSPASTPEEKPFDPSDATPFPPPITLSETLRAAHEQLLAAIALIPSPPAEDSKAAKFWLRASTQELSKLVSQETYATPNMVSFYSSVGGGSKGVGAGVGVSLATEEWVRVVGEVKSEIRGLKGMLLSRRNFPTAGA